MSYFVFNLISLQNDSVQRKATRPKQKEYNHAIFYLEAV